MSKIKSNAYDQALKQAKAFEAEHRLKDGALTSKIPAEIEESGKNHYHVLLVKLRNDKIKRQYIGEGVVQTFAKGKAWDKISKGFKTLSFETLIVVHNPTLVKKEETVHLAGHEERAIEAQIRKEEKEAAEKRTQERIAEAKAKALAGKQEAAKSASDLNPTGEGTGNPGGAPVNPNAGGSQEPNPLEFDGLVVTEENVDQFIADNKVETKAGTPKGKLDAVEKWIAAQSK